MPVGKARRPSRAFFESLERRDLFAAMSFIVTNVNDSGRGSLRDAILSADVNTSGPNSIKFDIPGAGTHGIVPLTALPNITSPTYINGSSQPGYAGKPLINLDGVKVKGAGLTIFGSAAHASMIRGLDIGLFNGPGISIDGANSVAIVGNYIGNDGVHDEENVTEGVNIEKSVGTRIGGTTPADRNIISGNGWSEINAMDLSGGVGSLTVEGNYVGTNAAGTAAIKPAKSTAENLPAGITYWNVLSGTIGGLTPGARNLVSGNIDGIQVYDGAFTNAVVNVEGNYIGTDVTGNKAIPNGEGIDWRAATGSVLGGTTAGARNIISGNSSLGIDNSTSGGVVTDSPAGSVEGNYIGTNAAGTAALPNQGGGFYTLDGDITVGGTTPGAGNVISGNKGKGLFFDAGHNSVIQGNKIGVGADGKTPIPNTGDGIEIGLNHTNDNIVGGSIAGANIIAFNGGAGVAIESSSSLHNLIRYNSIHDNKGLGIDLTADYGGPFGVTPNDAHDLDSGGNGLQNFPVLSSAVTTTLSGGSTTVTGTISSANNTTYIIDFYVNVAKDPAGYGEGQLEIGSAVVTTNGTGSVTFVIKIPKHVLPGTFISATATLSGRGGGDTSEFSKDVIVTG